MGFWSRLKFWEKGNREEETKVEIKKTPSKRLSLDDLSHLLEEEKQVKQTLKEHFGLYEPSKFEKALLMVSNKLPKLEDGQREIKRSINRENTRVIKEIKSTIEEMEEVQPESKEMEAGIKEIKGKSNKALVLNSLGKLNLNYTKIWEKLKGDMSKRTFNKWLKRLVKEGKVERTEGEGRKVFYSIKEEDQKSD